MFDSKCSPVRMVKHMHGTRTVRQNVARDSSRPTRRVGCSAITNPPFVATAPATFEVFVHSALDSLTSNGMDPLRGLSSILSQSRHGLPGFPFASGRKLAAGHVLQRIDDSRPMHRRSLDGLTSASMTARKSGVVASCEGPPMTGSISTIGTPRPSFSHWLVRSCSRRGPELT